MKVYIGQTRARWLTAELFMFGECTQRGELPPRRSPWFLDNGAYKDWKAGVEFDVATYRADLDSLRNYSFVRPEFMLAPDIVAGGVPSLARSREWVAELSEIAPVYLAVQDGMEVSDVMPELPSYAGLFVGGTLEWKISTGQTWVILAHDGGKPCHIGRVGTPNRILWARRIGADSIDSCLPLWSQDNLRRFRDALNSKQLEMF